MPYIPPHDAVDDPALIEEFIGAHPLAMLVTHDGTEPDTAAIPLLLVQGERGPELVGHVARANPLWRPGRQVGPVLAIFGPVEHYISPTWYPSTAEHHRAAPTWNYLVAQVWGDLVVHDDVTWVRGVIARLTNAMEAWREEPWHMGQAPADFTEELLRNVVGIQIPVTRMSARFKVSSHKSEADRLGARDGVAGERNGRGYQEVVDGMTHPPQLVSGDGTGIHPGEQSTT